MSAQESEQKPITRRQFMQQGSLAFAGLLLASCAEDNGEATPAQTLSQDDAGATAPQLASTLAPTPQCDDDETPAQTEGPFYTPETPQRINFLEDGSSGVPFILTGQVLSTSCEPLANAVLDFWHADDGGQYDNSGYRYRGHQFTDEQGRYRLETILPGLYPGRARHIHVKVQGQSTPLLTTQLYFPGEAGNAADGIFDEALLMELQEDGNIQSATFTFVLERDA